MIVRLVNQTHTANIYGVFENDERIGTVQVVLIGPNCGARAFTYKGKYNKRDIMRFYRQARKEERR